MTKKNITTFWNEENSEEKAVLLNSLKEAQDGLLECEEIVDQLREEKKSYINQLKELGLKANDLEWVVSEEGEQWLKFYCFSTSGLMDSLEKETK